jgi:hypothetical protein
MRVKGRTRTGGDGGGPWDGDGMVGCGVNGVVPGMQWEMEVGGDVE